jgi:hypothetical protein
MQSYINHQVSQHGYVLGTRDSFYNRYLDQQLDPRTGSKQRCLEQQATSPSAKNKLNVQQSCVKRCQTLLPPPPAESDIAEDKPLSGHQMIWVHRRVHISLHNDRTMLSRFETEEFRAYDMLATCTLTRPSDNVDVA